MTASQAPQSPPGTGQVPAQPAKRSAAALAKQPHQMSTDELEAAAGPALAAGAVSPFWRGLAAKSAAAGTVAEATSAAPGYPQGPAAQVAGRERACGRAPGSGQAAQPDELRGDAPGVLGLVLGRGSGRWAPEPVLEGGPAMTDLTHLGARVAVTAAESQDAASGATRVTYLAVHRLVQQIADGDVGEILRFVHELEHEEAWQVNPWRLVERLGYRFMLAAPPEDPGPAAAAQESEQPGAGACSDATLGGHRRATRLEQAGVA